MKKIINTIINIILCLAIIVEITYVSISNSINRNQIKENIKNNLLSGIIYNDNGTKTEIFKAIVRLTTLDEETVRKLMENETANEIITDIVNSIYDYNLTYDESVKYTEKQIIDIVNNNIDKVLMEIDYKISQQDRKEVIDYTKNNTKYILDTIYSIDIGEYTK